MRSLLGHRILNSFRQVARSNCRKHHDLVTLGKVFPVAFAGGLDVPAISVGAKVSAPLEWNYLIKPNLKTSG
jgi:hypothetical protein